MSFQVSAIAVVLISCWRLTELWFSAMFSVCCKPLAHHSLLNVFLDHVEGVPCDFPIVNPCTPFMVRKNLLWGWIPVFCLSQFCFANLSIVWFRRPYLSSCKLS
jgi:hypothetical protein